jgi:glycosyltransferase involved in cell wall biosynthesis
VQGPLLMNVKKRLGKFRPYLIARDVKWSIAASLKRVNERTVMSLRPDGPVRGNVLFSYKQALDTFLLKPGEPISSTHTNYWHSMQMVNTFLGLGCAVDVIDHSNNSFLPEKDYSVIVDVRRNLERLAPLLGEDCVKIMHLDTAHILFHNAAESRRLLELQQRKGVTLRPRRFEVPNLGIEHADCATTTGNVFTLSTFKYANKPIYRLPIAATISYPWPEGKNWEACRRRFLWFSSGGLVHKGLDLVLDAFAQMPEYHLTVSGPIEQEEDFSRAYHKELYQTSNIHTVGWIDLTSPQFTEIVQSCTGIILLSCSEGASTSTVHCMHAGLIPILTYECGLDTDDFGFLLKDCSIDNIKDTIRAVASLSTQGLKERARKAWEFARAHHTREKFAEEYRKVVEKILMTFYKEQTLDRSESVIHSLNSCRRVA